MTGNKYINGIAYNDYGGNNEPLIFIHAFPLSSRMWDRQVPFFVDKFRVITYDLRGLGNSKQSDYFFFTMESYCDDLIMLMDSLNILKAHVCGLSIGGYIIFRTFQKYPNRFLSLTLSNTKADRDSNDGLINRANMLKEVLSSGLEKLSKEFPRKLLSESGIQNDELLAEIEHNISSQDTKGVAGAILALATRTDCTDMLDTINVPVQLIAGSEDKLTPPDSLSELSEKIALSTFSVINNAGHLTAVEQPDEFNRILSGFLSSLPEYQS